MKSALALLSSGFLALVAAAPASAQVAVSLGINPCGYPTVYQACPYYGPPVGVYVGGGAWGGDRGWRGDRDHRGDHRGDQRGGRGTPAHGGGRHR